MGVACICVFLCVDHQLPFRSSYNQPRDIIPCIVSIRYSICASNRKLEETTPSHSWDEWGLYTECWQLDTWLYSEPGSFRGEKTSSQKIELFLHQAFRGNLTTNDCPFFVFLFQGTVDPSSVMYNEISPQAAGYFYIFLYISMSNSCMKNSYMPCGRIALTLCQNATAARKCFDDPWSMPSSTGRHRWDNL
jgi:hypothetical protein